jgi:hypothetical protein
MHILDLRRAVRPALVLVALVALLAALVPAGTPRRTCERRPTRS